MSAQQERPIQPPSYQRDIQSLKFPAVPTTDLPSSATRLDDSATATDSTIRNKPLERAGPSQRPLAIQDLINASSETMELQRPHRSSEASEQTSSSSRTNSGLDTDSTTMDIDSTASGNDRAHRAGSVVSIDDPDVRIAAEALGDLRAGKVHMIDSLHEFMADFMAKDFVQSPPGQYNSPKDSSFPPRTNGASASFPSSQQPEPLLSLFTSSHPILGTAINGSLSAYTSSKSYSPSFRYGAEFMERHIGSPVVSTVSSVGRKTGVEGGMRWWLNGRQRSRLREELNDEHGAPKRRKMEASVYEPVDLEKGPQDAYQLSLSSRRRQSEGSFADSLPAYDELRSPEYEPHSALVAAVRVDDGNGTEQNPNWQRRLMLSTSGLGVAMSEESLRSLKYCLDWLRWANGHIGRVIVALKDVLDEWDQSQAQVAQANGQSEAITDRQPGSGPLSSQIPAQTQYYLTNRIQNLKSDVMETIKKVVDVISTYAGGALPENARLLVRRHLFSLPQRFHLASLSTAPADSSRPASETVTSAHRVMVLAKEGLDMMAQVSGVLDGTIVSAEDWCERLGRRKRSESEMAIDEKAAVTKQEENTTSNLMDQKSG
ncbi:MAG: hypothetical protein M1824_004670 [Vezdaea acicularis]|nr:MAG: hypothetical protein M1824_004670 [Vezdaea acicularis]